MTYPGPSGFDASSQYKVTLNQGGSTYSSFVYLMNNTLTPGTGGSSELDTSWTSFSYSGTVTVTIQVLQGNFSSARVLPTSAGIPIQSRGTTATFELTGETGQFAIDFCETGLICQDSNDPVPLHPLLVFANPIEKNPPSSVLANVQNVVPGTKSAPAQSIPPLTSNENLLYFGPGVYDLTASYPAGYTIGSGQTVYLAGGAYVYGFFKIASEAKGASLTGRGILSGELVSWTNCHTTSCPAMVNGPPSASGTLVEGVTLILSPAFNIQLSGTSNIVRNVKIIAWHVNTDGIMASSSAGDPGSIIEDSFVKNADDSLKLYSPNLTVQRVRIWKLNIGGCFQLGGECLSNQPKQTSTCSYNNINVSDSDIIRSEYAYLGYNNAVFSFLQLSPGNVSDVTFDNIRVENSKLQLFKLILEPNKYNRGAAQLGSLNNFNFNNISVTSAQIYPDLFQSYSLQSQISNITMNNVVVGGVTYPPTPTAQFYANRTLSYAGTIIGDWVWRSNNNSQGFQIWTPNKVNSPIPSPSPSATYISTSVTAQINLNSAFTSRTGDFFGDGYADLLVQNTSNVLGIWKDPVQNLNEP